MVVLSEDGANMTWDEVDDLRIECDIPPWSLRGPDSKIGGEIGLSERPSSSRRGEEGRILHVIEVEAPMIEPAPLSTESFLSSNDVLSVRPMASSSGPPPSSGGSSPILLQAADVETTQSSPQLQLRVTKLLWLDPQSVDHLARQEPWDDVVATIPPTRDERERPRRAVLEALRRGEPADAALIEHVFAHASDKELFEAPFVVTDGSMSLHYDDIARLRATVSAAAPFADGSHLELSKVVEHARHVLALPWLDGGVGIADELIRRIRHTFEEATDRTAGYLDAQSERILVHERAYQYRSIWGGHYIRCSFRPDGARASFPTYLPDKRRHAAAALRSLPRAHARPGRHLGRSIRDPPAGATRRGVGAPRRCIGVGS